MLKSPAPLANAPTTLRGQPQAACLPVARAFTSSVVNGVPPIPKSPLFTSSITTQVTLRMFSPSIQTTASVSFFTISRFCESENVPSMTLTLTNGINYSSFGFLLPAQNLSLQSAYRLLSDLELAGRIRGEEARI